ncbi:MAG: hypothetical protein V7632_584 [Bradyrhizobium sp.]|jgi:hypothetical protein
MTGRWISLVAGGATLLSMTPALAGPPVETSLLYLEPGDWPKQSSAQRIALAADFMRIFCTDQSMPSASLAACLDRDGSNGRLFERAIACVASRGR